MSLTVFFLPVFPSNTAILLKISTHLMQVVYKLEFDAKRRGRSVPHHTHTTCISQKDAKRNTAKNTAIRPKIRQNKERKFNFIKIFFHLYINGGTQERIFKFIKKIFHLYINGVTQERIIYFHKKNFAWYYQWEYTGKKIPRLR